MVDASTNSLTNTEEPHFQTELGLNKAHTQLLANEGKNFCAFMLDPWPWLAVGRSIDSEQYLKISQRQEAQIRKSTWESDPVETTAASNH